MILSSRWLLPLLLIVLVSIFAALVAAEGGWQELPQLLGRECAICAEALKAALPGTFTR